MDIWQILTLALVQGLTEFLPISSSAHLILVPELTAWPDQGLAFDVAVHVGTLLAVVGYFRRDLRAMTAAWIGSWQGRGLTAEARLAWLVLLATLPVALVGLLLKDWIEIHLRSATVIAWASIGFGVLLGLSDYLGRRRREVRTMRWLDGLLIGLAQVLALIPGTSRSGITMTAGLALGLTREAAARFAFLLAIPVIALAGGVQVVDLLQQPEAANWGVLLAGTGLAALSAYLCIHWFLQWVQRVGMLPFVVYRIGLGVVLLIMF